VEVATAVRGGSVQRHGKSEARTKLFFFFFFFRAQLVSPENAATRETISETTVHQDLLVTSLAHFGTRLFDRWWR